jgi:23S rRNA (guanosine2251-2'-O)-methyltransferase
MIETVKRTPKEGTLMTLLTNRNSIVEAIRQHPRKLGRLWIEAGHEHGADKIIEEARRAGVSWRVLSGDEYAKRFKDVRSHICLEKEEFEYSSPETLLRLLEPGAGPLFSALDGVFDPQNLGNIIRTAACSSSSGIILPKDRACSVNDTVINVAQGGAEHVPIARVTNLARFLSEMKKRNVFCYGLDERADRPLWQVSLTGPICLVFGGEDGLRRLTKETCDELVRIPSNPAFPTMNVATSFAIAHYEAMRQRTVRSEV